MSLILDTGALVALERNERPMWVRLKAAQLDGDVPLTHAGVIGQAWRGGPRQARLATALKGIHIHSIDETTGRLAGQLLGAAELHDVIDAAVALLAHDGDSIITSDHDDLETLANTLGRHIELVYP
ncbi:MAG: hypothetical protein R8J94_21860 [Acidimicrobiia bacterium]|nr:hypothetical protein [Acidimicrobiia bacterium]